MPNDRGTGRIPQLWWWRLFVVVALSTCLGAIARSADVPKPLTVSDGADQAACPKLFVVQDRAFVVWVNTSYKGAVVTRTLRCRRLLAGGRVGEAVRIKAPDIAGLPQMDWVATGGARGLIMHPQTGSHRRNGEPQEYAANGWLFDSASGTFDVEGEECSPLDCPKAGSASAGDSEGQTGSEGRPAATSPICYVQTPHYSYVAGTTRDGDAALSILNRALGSVTRYGLVSQRGVPQCMAWLGGSTLLMALADRPTPGGLWFDEEGLRVPDMIHWPRPCRITCSVTKDLGITWRAGSLPYAQANAVETAGTVDGQGRVWVVTTAVVNKEDERTCLFLSVSADGGDTWSKPARITSGEALDRQPSAVVFGNSLHVAFSRREGGVSRVRYLAMGSVDQLYGRLRVLTTK